MMTVAPRRVLVVGPAWVGDMVMSQTLYKVLKSNDTDTQIDVLAPPASLPLVTRMAEVSRGIRFEAGHGELKIGYRWRIAAALRQNHYDQAIVLPNSFKSGLVPFFSGIPVRTGYRGEFRYYLINDMRALDRRKLPRMVDRFVALGLREGHAMPGTIEYPSLTVDAENQRRIVHDLGLDISGPILGLCPGAEYGDAKQWPESHFAELADFAVNAGMKVWLFGSARDSETAGNILSAMSDGGRRSCVDLTGKTRLEDAIDLLASCRLVISNDSGLMHVAAAVGCATAVIYGSTSPLFTPPLTDRVEIVSDNLPCSPCFRRTCPLGHKNCLNLLMPERLEAIVTRHAETATP